MQYATRLGFVACIFLAACSVHAAEALKYTLLLDNGTRVAGTETVQRVGDVTRVHYVFKDNGRGPETDEEFRQSGDGTFTSYKIKGHTTFGSPINEQFTLKGREAAWRSDSERGRKTLADSAMYVPLNSSSVSVMAVFLEALQKRGEKPLPLLPGGELQVRGVEKLDVKRGSETRSLELVAVSGMGLQPVFIWTVNRTAVFAFIVPGYLTEIEDGWQENAPLLNERQKAAESSVLKEMASAMRHPMPGVSVIRNARVFDSERATLGARSDVYVLRGRITAVLPAGSPAEGVSTEIDAGGRVLLPGLFDMHGHIGRWDGALNIAAGVTTVRDMGNDNDSLQEIIDEVADGRVLSPRVVPAGFLEGEGENSASQGFHIRDLPGAKKAIDWYAEHGYPQLKIYNSFPKDILRETVAYAHSRGMRVSGHVPAFLRAQDVVEQGFDEIQHINQVLLNFLVTPTTDTRTLDRFYLPAEKLADLDLDSKPVQDFLSLLKRHNTTIDPTVGTFAFIAQRNGEVLRPYAPFVDNITLDIQRLARVAEMKIPDDKTAVRYRKSYEKMLEFVGRMYKAGIPLVAGTDDLTGFMLHSELELYVEAGLTPAQALQIATRNGALYSRTLNDRGSIEPGKLADLILVDGDPTVRIGDIRKVNLVLTQSHWISPSEIYKRIGVKPFVPSTVPVKAVAK